MSDQKSSKTLYKEDDGRNGVSIEIYFSEKGQLTVLCVEYGETVKKVRGDWDDELYLTVEKEHLHQLRDRIWQKSKKNVSEDNDLLDWFVNSFKSREAFRNIKTYFIDNNIPYRFFNWT